MTSRKSTKRALITSALAILMCVAMLIGTTFAWFTDTASTGVNKIQAGNLKMEVSYKNTSDGEFAVLNESTNVFMKDTLWEPGHVEYAVLKVKNTGTLALKYKLGINIVGETGSINVLGNEFKLSDYIKFGVVDEDLSGKTRDEMVAAVTDSKLIKEGYSKESHLDTTDANETVTLVVWMPTDVGNKANYKVGAAVPEINLGINVAATQYTHESDSFGNQYDKDAQYPDVAYTQASTQDELNTALNNPTDANGNPTSKIAVDLKKGSYTLPGDKMGNKEISITGTKDTVIDLTSATTAHNASITMEGVKVKSTNGDYTGIQHAAATIFKDCVIEGQPFLYAKDAQYINCTFEQTSSDAYNVWTYGAGKVLFKDCTFNCAGKSVLIYNEGSINGQTVEFENCKFNATAPVTGKAAIEIDSSLLPDGCIYKVIIDQATADNVTGFDNGSVSHNSLWNNKKGTKATVIVAGTPVLSAG